MSSHEVRSSLTTRAAMASFAPDTVLQLRMTFAAWET